MVWFRVDDTFGAHPKARRAGLPACGFWAVAGSWASQQLTDGHVPAWYADTWPGGKKHATSLVAAQLWHKPGHDCDRCPQIEEGWQFHDWNDWNPTRVSVEAEREAAKERMRKAREKKAREKAEQERVEQETEKGQRSDEVRANVRPNERRSSVPRSPTPTRPDPLSTSSGDDSTDLATSDADEAHTFERTPAQHLAARYAAGVPLSKHHGQAMRTLGTALDLGYDPAMLERAVDVLIAEQRQCTPDTLRIAIGAAPGNWGTAVRPAGNTSHLDDLRNAGPGVAEAAFRRLFAVPDGDHADPDLPALEA